MLEFFGRGLGSPFLHKKGLPKEVFKRIELMNVSLILAHPNRRSFNHAIARTAGAQLEMNGHNVLFHDLYAENFDPILPVVEIPTETTLPPEIQKNCDEISSADGIVIVHPNWWGQPPAILKGWVDRVIRPDVAYKFLEEDTGEGVPVGLLKAQTAIVFNTANTPARREREVFGDPLQLLWKNCIFDLCGVSNFYRRMFAVVVTSTYEERQGWLEEVEQVIDRYFPSIS
jgi:NAD(P)H dehydrogenase (quinone)